ncbi:hypothetical protein R3P38DRAFT_2761200 [Favolaschia claudopus]|uniref:Uncharacterized protein n=1 Tax=Favolaschia claudopus TaxID=2862362 RepID=A0AAW0E023_9AGAR
MGVSSEMCVTGVEANIQTSRSKEREEIDAASKQEQTDHWLNSNTVLRLCANPLCPPLPDLETRFVTARAAALTPPVSIPLTTAAILSFRQLQWPLRQVTCKPPSRLSTHTITLHESTPDTHVPQFRRLRSKAAADKYKNIQLGVKRSPLLPVLSLAFYHTPLVPIRMPPPSPHLSACDLPVPRSPSPITSLVDPTPPLISSAPNASSTAAITSTNAVDLSSPESPPQHARQVFDALRRGAVEHGLEYASSPALTLPRATRPPTLKRQAIHHSGGGGNGCERSPGSPPRLHTYESSNTLEMRSTSCDGHHPHVNTRSRAIPRPRHHADPASSDRRAHSTHATHGLCASAARTLDLAIAINGVTGFETGTERVLSSSLENGSGGKVLMKRARYRQHMTINLAAACSDFALPESNATLRAWTEWPADGIAVASTDTNLSCSVPRSPGSTYSSQQHPSPIPSTPSLGYSPSSTESSSGDRTIQKSTFMNDNIAPFSHDIVVISGGNEVPFH